MSKDNSPNDSTQTFQVSHDERLELLSLHPFFSKCSKDALNELIDMMEEVHYSGGEKIVEEDCFVDDIFFVVRGRGKVIRQEFFNGSRHSKVIAILDVGEAIGLADRGFFSQDGRRTATVIAMTETLLLKVSVTDFNLFIKRHFPFDKELESLSDLMLKLHFIRRSYPFACLEKEQIYEIASEIQEITLPSNTLLFYQNEPAECCYLIREGQVEIFLPEKDGSEKRIAILGAPELVGEAALLTSGIRNASARALTDLTLLVLERSTFLKLIETSTPFAESVWSFLLRRFRPSKGKNVVLLEVTLRNQKVYMLQNTELDQFYELTEQTLFLWEALDGVQAIRDLTVAFFKKFQIFAPDMICSFLYNLAEAKFVEIPEISVDLEGNESSHTFFEKFINKIKTLSTKEISFKQADPWLTKMYQGGIWILFHPATLLCFLCVIIAGMFVFFDSRSSILLKAKNYHLDVWPLILGMIPISAIGVFLHEAAHAFAAKRCGYRIHRIGVGWFFFSPIAFVDTSALWLADRKSKLFVDGAGVYVDLIVASCLSLLSFFTEGAISIYFWLFGLVIYLNVFKNFSPIREYDGYYILSDLLDAYKLRKSSFEWLVMNLQKKYNKETFKNHAQEAIYWLSCTIYFIFYVILMYLVPLTIFKIFSVYSFFNFPIEVLCVYFSAVMSVLSLLTVLWEIKTHVINKRA